MSLADFFVQTAPGVVTPQLAIVTDEDDDLWDRELLVLVFTLTHTATIPLDAPPRSRGWRERIRAWDGIRDPDFNGFLIRARNKGMVKGLHIEDNQLTLLLHDSFYEAGLNTAREFAPWFVRHTDLEIALPVRAKLQHMLRRGKRAATSESARDYAELAADSLAPGLGSVIRMVREWLGR